MQCKKCKEKKPLTDFRIDKRNNSGYYHYCKKCVSLISLERIRKIKEGTIQAY